MCNCVFYVLTIILSLLLVFIMYFYILMNMARPRSKPEASIYQRLNQVLDLRGESVAALAEKIGVTKASVYRSLTKSSGLEHYWPDLAKWLDVSLDWLLIGRLGHAPAEFVRVDGQVAMGDSSVSLTGQVIGDVSSSPTPSWPGEGGLAFTFTTGRWVLRITEPIPPLLEVGDLLSLDVPVEECLGDARPDIFDGSLMAIQGQDRRCSIGFVTREAKHGWFVLTSLQSKTITSVWMDADILKIYCITAILKSRFTKTYIPGLEAPPSFITHGS